MTNYQTFIVEIMNWKKGKYKDSLLNDEKFIIAPKNLCDTIVCYINLAHI